MLYPHIGRNLVKRIAIVGGGIAGLTAAYELAQQARNGASIEVVLFESSNRLGGIVETVREGGFIIECGPAAWVTEKPWAKALAEELGLADAPLHPIPDVLRMMVPPDLTALDNSNLFSPEAKQAFHAETTRADELKNT